MKITPQILSIPPYISTCWKSIASLHVEIQSHEEVLVITLHSGARIDVPGLQTALIETIFTAHLHSLEVEEKTQILPLSSTNMNLSTLKNPGQFGLELLSFNTSPTMMGFTAFTHDPEQSASPALPEEILDKIGELAETMGVDDPNTFPAPEENCNCMRCQITRAIQNSLHRHGQKIDQKEEQEEIVSDSDISFSSWNVTQTQDKLFLVTNPLENTEKYHVHLGSPIGCTCGDTGCAHIRAVLKT